MLLRYAYPLLDSQIAGGPAWIDSARFDIEGRPGTGTAPLNEIQLMLASLLEDRFRMKAHFDTRELPVYDLVLANRPKIKPSADQTPPPPPQSPSDLKERGTAMIEAEEKGMIATGNAVPISTLVGFLQMHSERRVIDKTGLSGLFDFQLQFSPLDTPQTPADIDGAFPALPTALESQLGLKIESPRGPQRFW